MKSSNKSFGIVFFLFFSILGIYPIWNDDKLNLILISIGIIFLILGIRNSNILTSPNKYWIKFGLVLGKLISPIIMFIIYFFLLFPISLLGKLVGRDTCNTSYNPNIKSYWIKRNDDPLDMDEQY
jgi:hypothetical protein